MLKVASAHQHSHFTNAIFIEREHAMNFFKHVMSELRSYYSKQPVKLFGTIITCSLLFGCVQTFAFDMSEMVEVAKNIARIQSGNDRLKELQRQVEMARHDFDTEHYDIVEPLNDYDLTVYSYTPEFELGGVYIFRAYAHREFQPYTIAFDDRGVVYLLGGFEANDFSELTHHITNSVLTKELALRYAILYLHTVKYNYYRSANVVHAPPPLIQESPEGYRIVLVTEENEFDSRLSIDKVKVQHEFQVYYSGEVSLIGCTNLNSK